MHSHPLCIFSFSSCLIPFLRISIKRCTARSMFIGYDIYYVFGIRVAMIQKTNPWE